MATEYFGNPAVKDMESLFSQSQKGLRDLASLRCGESGIDWGLYCESLC